jgi:hypothetical protein
MKPMANRLPVGEGSRGGHWHEPEFRAAWWVRYRREHPTYYQGDLNRRRLTHAMTRLARVVAGGSYERPS